MAEGLVRLLEDLENKMPAHSMGPRRGFAELLGLSESERLFVAHGVSETILPSSYRTKFRRGMKAFMQQIDIALDKPRIITPWDLMKASWTGKNFKEKIGKANAMMGNVKIIDIRDHYFPESVFDIIHSKFTGSGAEVPRKKLPGKVTRFISSQLRRFEIEYNSSLSEAKHAERAVASGKGDVYPDMVREMERYNSKRAPLFLEAGLAVKSLTFDLRNLLLDDFHDERVKRVLTGEEHKERVRLSGFPSSGLTSFVKSYPVRKDMAAVKKFHLKDKEDELLEGIYLPLALRLYALNLQRSLEGVPEDESRALQILKRVEFEDFVNNGEFRKYVERLGGKEDLFSRVGKRIGSLSAEDEDISLEYLSLFRNPDNRTCERIVKYSREGFIDLWKNAFVGDWGFELLGGLDNLDDVLEDDLKINILASQKDSSLIDLLRDSGFRQYFTSRGSSKIDYALLGRLRELDSVFFERVYPKIGSDDNQFLTNIVDLVANTDYDFSDVSINRGVKHFLGDVKGYSEDERESLSFVLSNFDLASRALEYGLTPFPGDGIELEDKIGFSNWVLENSGVLEDVTHYEVIEPYLGDSKSELLKESLIGLSRGHGREFARVCLNKFRGMDVHPLIRISSLLAESKSPKKLCRKREYVFSLEHLALTLSDFEWGKFSSEVLEDGDSTTDYEALYLKRNALLEKRSESVRNEKVGKTSDLRELYHQFRGSGHESLVDRLMRLRITDISRKAAEGIGRYLLRGQMKLAEKIIEGVEEGIFGNKGAEEIVRNYHDDLDIDDIPLSEFIEKEYVGKRSDEKIGVRQVETWSYSFTPSAERDFDGLEEGVIKNKLVAQLDGLRRDPFAGKRLRNHFTGYRSARVEHLRLIYEIRPEGRDRGKVLVHRIGHRGGVYDKKI
jgi:mRNA-degrading endonuclease RelE of RelBE toxin-antitoxin system